jgi:hypothetical protein
MLLVSCHSHANALVDWPVISSAVTSLKLWSGWSFSYVNDLEDPWWKTTSSSERLPVLRTRKLENESGLNYVSESINNAYYDTHLLYYDWPLLWNWSAGHTTDISCVLSYFFINFFMVCNVLQMFSHHT